jgi:uncharacterized integral membrane protein (TIGR00698 family)
MNKKYTTAGLILLLIACAFPFVTAPIALLAGIIYSVSIGNPIIEKTSKWTHKLLQFSVVGLGFGMNATVALESGRKGLLYTAAGIIFAFGLGYILSKIIKVEKKTSFLISAGTAICGGSAIAAVAPIIEAKSEETSVSLGVVFILNSVALLIFPIIGHYLNLSQEQFGLWSAIAIHDTSSVVGASSQYGKEALAIATTVKLTRALWIIPVSLVSGLVFKSSVKKIKIPYFIFVFILAMLCNTFLPSMSDVFHIVYAISKQGLVVTLFLIGSNLSLNTLKTVGVRPFIMGIALWIIVATVTLIAV